VVPVSWPIRTVVTTLASSERSQPSWGRVRRLAWVDLAQLGSCRRHSAHKRLLAEPRGLVRLTAMLARDNGTVKDHAY
jgi:hypothetical protein